jgi:predicted dehydrogenase
MYELRNRQYIGAERADGHPAAQYHEYADFVPEWAVDVSDLQPEASAVFDPSEDSTGVFYELCGGDATAVTDTPLSPAAQGQLDRWTTAYGGPITPSADPDVFQSLEEFIEEGEYDVVFVSSPNALHPEAVVPLLERDVDVYCEKPLATTLEDHDTLIDAAERSDGLLYPGFNLRHSPFFVELHRLANGGPIGDLGMIDAREVRTPFGPGFRYETSDMMGGSLLEKNVHDFDLFNWYADGDPVEVFADGGQHVFHRNTDAIDHASVVVRYDNDVTATLNLCLYAPYDQRTRTYELRGSTGIARCPEDEDAIDVFGRDAHRRIQTHTAGQAHGGSELHLLTDVLRCVKGDRSLPYDATDAKKAAAIAIAAQRSIAEETSMAIDGRYDVEPV